MASWKDLLNLEEGEFIYDFWDVMPKKDDKDLKSEKNKKYRGTVLVLTNRRLWCCGCSGFFGNYELVFDVPLESIKELKMRPPKKGFLSQSFAHFYAHILTGDDELQVEITSVDHPFNELKETVKDLWKEELPKGFREELLRESKKPYMELAEIRPFRFKWHTSHNITRIEELRKRSFVNPYGETPVENWGILQYFWLSVTLMLFKRKQELDAK